jgi:hypothetical protein
MVQIQIAFSQLNYTCEDKIIAHNPIMVTKGNETYIEMYKFQGASE